MAERKKSEFRPRWLQSGSPFDTSEDAPPIGILRDATPRLPIRVLPRGNRHTLSAQTVSDTLELTQRIITFSAFEVVNGASPSFSDLRTVSDAVNALARLEVDPFEDGSFVIPTRLREQAFPTEGEAGVVNVGGADVLTRFSLVMNAVAHDSNFPTAIGLLEAVEDLGKVLKREATGIEYYPTVYSAKLPFRRVSIDSDYVSRVSANRRRRESPIEHATELTGRLTAVDVGEGKFKLAVKGRHVVLGTFTPLMQMRMIQYLNKRVKLSGTVTYVRSAPRKMRAVMVEIVDELI